MATRQDVANAANVSCATVTNVYNGTKYVSPEIIKKVLSAAKQVGYSDKRILEFVFLSDDPYNPHNLSIYDGMVQAAEKLNVIVSLMSFSDDFDLTCKQLIDKNVSGVFISNSYHSISKKQCSLLENHGIAVSASWNDFQIDLSVVPEITIKYLADLGHTKIAYLSNRNVEDTSKLNVYKSALKKFAIEYNPNLFISGSHPFYADFFNGYTTAKKLLDSKEKFTAIVTANDLMAIGAMKAIHEAGLRIPEDVSIIGCDNIPISEYSNPPLTTVHLPAKELGRKCLQNLVLRKEGETPAPIHANLNVVVRESTSSINQNK